MNEWTVINGALYYYETTEQTFLFRNYQFKMCELFLNELYQVEPKQSTIKVPGGDSTEAQWYKDWWFTRSHIQMFHLISAPTYKHETQK